MNTMKSIPDEQLQTVIRSFNGRAFSTYDFACALKRLYPITWDLLEKEYGVGGAGAGKEYSVYSRIAHSLNKVANSEALTKLDYGSAPAGWGSPVIRYWTADTTDLISPDEILDPDTVTEGAKQTVIVNKFERSPSARIKCIEKWGLACTVCGFDFEATYGNRGAGFIHVHHLKPLAEIGEEYQLNPIKDLRPVCPNCHAMLHRSVPAISIQELKSLLRNSPHRNSPVKRTTGSEALSESVAEGGFRLAPS